MKKMNPGMMAIMAKKKDAPKAAAGKMPMKGDKPAFLKKGGVAMKKPAKKMAMGGMAMKKGGVAKKKAC